MNSELITKQLMHLYTLHTQPRLIISPDGEIRTEIYWTDNEAEKLFNALQKYLEPNKVSQEWLDMLKFCAAELDRVCGIRDIDQGRRLYHDKS